MSDGTDPATLPFQYGLVKYHLKHSPGQLFFGAIPNPFGEAPEGNALWMPWNEKILAIILSPFVSLEQLSTWIVYLLLILNGLSAYWFGRTMGWPKALCVAIAICWAFNPFTRGRAKVHMSLTGIYYLPLLFVGMNYILRSTHWRSIAMAATAFFLAVTVAQYYLLMTAFLFPLFVFYLIWNRGELPWSKLVLNSAIAAIPAVAFTAFCFFKPLPSSFVKPGVVALPKTGEYKDPSGVHPFLKVFAARPLDYFAGDIAIGPADWNPIRAAITDNILKNLENSNPHERANGIRWSLWILFFLGLYYIFNRPKDLSPYFKNNFIYFAAFATVGLLLSLPPGFFGIDFMPAAWLHAVVSQFRVPSRASTFVHFGVLACAILVYLNLFYEPTSQPKKKHKDKKKSDSQDEVPLSISSWRPQSNKWARRMALPVVLPIIAIVDLPPALNKMPVSPVLPAYSALTGPQSTPCGYGMYFPYVSTNHALREMYYFIQRMRGSECKIINGGQVETRNSLLLRNFAHVQKLFEQVNLGNPAIPQRLVQLARCVPLEWLVFDERLPSAFGPDVCQQLGWEWHAPDVCRDRTRGKELKTLPEDCLK